MGPFLEYLFNLKRNADAAADNKIFTLVLLSFLDLARFV